MKDHLNWVERRVRREANLSHTDEVWESVRTAIFDSCESYNQNYSELGHAKPQSENGHRVRVIVTIGRAVRNVSFEFVDNLITSTVDRQGAKRFSISSDESHAFLEYSGEEITADRLTEIALENAFFKLPAAPGPAPRRIRNFHQTQSDLE